ncbi:MAG: hypothetical protein E6Q33_08995 [Neisseriales bacterium]|nr:MAG: hypothetical protein E6Q33_08995 [Neisseriales bacterium]
MATRAIVTNKGKELIAAAGAIGNTVKLKYFAVGDGSGNEYIPDGTEISLKKENWRTNIGSIAVNPKDKKELFIDTPVPEDVGGWWIREYGIFDEDNNLILIGTPTPFYKAKTEEGEILVIDFNLSLTLQNIASVQFIVDPSAYVTHQYLKESDYQINGLLTYSQRPKCEDSVFALKSDLDGIGKYPDITDQDGIVNIRKPDGTAAKMIFNSIENPSKSTIIDGINGIQLKGTAIKLYRNE